MSRVATDRNGRALLTRGSKPSRTQEGSRDGGAAGRDSSSTAFMGAATGASLLERYTDGVGGVTSASSSISGIVET